MAATVGEFRVRFPEFSDPVDYPDARIQMALDDAAMFMGTNEQRWCNSGKYDLAQSYLAAHLLVIGDRTAAGDTSGAVGPIASKSAGGVSVTRAVFTNPNTSDLDLWLSSTGYGQYFLAIRRTCFVGVTVANVL